MPCNQAEDTRLQDKWQFNSSLQNNNEYLFSLHRLIWLRWLEWLTCSGCSAPQVQRARQGNSLPQGGAGFIRMIVKGGWVNYPDFQPHPCIWALYLQGCSTPELAGADPWISNSFFGPFFLPGPYPIFEQVPVCSPEALESSNPSLLFCPSPQDPELLPELQIGCLKPGERIKQRQREKTFHNFSFMNYLKGQSPVTIMGA